MSHRANNFFGGRLAGWSGIGLALAAMTIPLVVVVIARLPSLAAPEPRPQRAAEYAAGPVRSTTQVLASIQQLKLLTVQVEAAVRTTAVDERWRGTATATIEAPARFHYGIDLAKLDRDAVEYDYLTQTYTLTIPEPQLIAVEVGLDRPLHEEIQTTGLRMDAMSGQKQMIRAQRSLHEHAQSFELPPNQRERMRQTTLEQTRQALSTFAGPTARVVVRYREP
jgi:hypothetical protein